MKTTQARWHQPNRRPEHTLSFHEDHPRSDELVVSVRTEYGDWLTTITADDRRKTYPGSIQRQLQQLLRSLTTMPVDFDVTWTIHTADAAHLDPCLRALHEVLNHVEAGETIGQLADHLRAAHRYAYTVSDD